MTAKKSRPINPQVLLLRAEFRRQKLTVYRLAQLSGVAEPTISRVFSGKAADPQMSTVQRLATSLGKSLEIR